MSDGGVHRDALRMGARLTVGAVTLWPIERTVVACERSAGRSWCRAAKQVHALIVGDAQGTRALGVDGSAMPIAALRAQVSGLEAALATLPGTSRGA